MDGDSLICFPFAVGYSVVVIAELYVVYVLHVYFFRLSPLLQVGQDKLEKVGGGSVR